MWERELKRARIVALWFILELLPTWERELKPFWLTYFMVALIIAPYVGAWVETKVGYMSACPKCIVSLPTWERELKRVWATILLLRRKSLPVWERELKPSLLKCFAAAIYYRFLHGSVSWNSDKTFKSETLSALMILRNSLVAPYVGACVERSIIPLVRGNFLYVGLCVEINVQY